MTDRRAREVEVSSAGAADETERGGSNHPPSATMRVASARGDAGLHVVLTQRRSEIVERFVRTFREENVARPDASRAAVIDDLVFFLADLADALRDSIPPNSDRARRHGNRRHMLGFDLGAVLREYSVLRSCILGVARDARITPSADELSLLDRTIDHAMSDAALSYAEQRDGEVRAERAALEAERARLAEAVASRDDVLAIVSHDLRNPLTSIALGVDQLRRHSGDGARRERVLDSIERSAQRMTTLIEDLLAIAKIDAGQLALNMAAADAGVLVDDALTVVRPLADAKSIQLSANVPPDTILRCDRDRLLQVFGNLLGNALKFTPENGAISIEARIEKGVVRFVVRDTGPGIPSDSLPYVFDRFYQGPGRRRGGAGLGLAIARAIVEAHGGSISVESAVGAGTTFQFTVPLADGQRRSTV
jgi:signal transduction histidine kinase